MTLFKQYRQQPGTYHPLGNRRVYSTKWLNTWVNWERDNATVDRVTGSYLTCIRPRDNGKQRRAYLDMSMADIEIDLTRDRVLQWNRDTSTDPVNTKYMSKHYINGVSLKDLAHMSTNDFLRFIERLPCGDGGKKWKGCKRKVTPSLKISESK